MACKVVVEHLNHLGSVTEVWREVGVAEWLNAQETWYLLTCEPIRTAEAAWQIVCTYRRRWHIKICWRYGTRELVLESPRLWSWDRRPKVLLSATPTYALLLSSFTPAYLPVQRRLLRFWCHRSGKRRRDVSAPL